MYEYSIGDFARQIGMSPDTLKHYERLGLLSCRHNEENGYRYLDLSQVENLFFTRSRVTGLAGIRRDFDSLPSESKFISELSTIEKALERQVAISQKSLERAQELIGKYALLADRNAEFVEEPVSQTTLLYLPFANQNGFLRREKAELAEFGRWREMCPIVSFSVAFGKAQEDEARFGLLAGEETARTIDLDTIFATSYEGIDHSVYYLLEIKGDAWPDFGENIWRSAVEIVQQLAVRRSYSYDICLAEDLLAFHQEGSTIRMIKAHFLEL